MKVLLVHKEEEHDKCQSFIKELIENFQTTIIARANFEKSNLDNQDLVLTLGGDGTFITVAQVTDLPIVAVNSNPETSEGALTNFQVKDKEKIIEKLKKPLKTETLPAIEVEVNNKKINIYAVNDVYIGALKHYHVSRYKLKSKDKEEEQRSSGILIVTSTGSTAWWKSAGGTPFQEGLRFRIREPFIRNIFKPTLLEGDAEGLEIEIKASNSITAFDSQAEIPLNPGDKIKVRLIKDKIKRVI